jgi:hypothetical protein
MKKIIYSAIIFISSNIAFAQPQFQEITNTPLENVKVGDVAFADIDGDSDQDVLITGLFGSQRIANLYSNDGNGNYSLITGTPFEGVAFSSVAFADIDGDSDQDVLISGENTSGLFVTKLYTNDGSGNFSVVNFTPFIGVSKGDIAFSDIDNDGDQYVMIVGENNNIQGSCELYSNDGSGNYVQVLFTPFVGLMEGTVDFADVDGDGDQDVLLTGINDNNQKVAVIHTNNGSGTFSSIVVANQFIGVNESSVAFADIDQDNDQDVFIIGLDDNYQRTTNIYINNGSGSFSAMLFPPFFGVSDGDIDVADVDGDTDLDVVIIGKNNNNELKANLYTNGGSGNYSLVNGMPFVPVSLGSINFSDINGDNYPEVLITGLDTNNQATTSLYQNISNVGVNEVNMQSIQLYPNPTINTFKLKLNSFTTDTQITVTTTDGKTVYFNNNINSNILNIDASMWENGIYLISVQTNTANNTVKLIKH